MDLSALAALSLRRRFSISANHISSNSKILFLGPSVSLRHKWQIASSLLISNKANTLRRFCHRSLNGDNLGGTSLRIPKNGDSGPGVASLSGIRAINTGRKSSSNFEASSVGRNAKASKPATKRARSKRDHLEDQGLLKDLRAIASAEKYRITELTHRYNWRLLTPDAAYTRFKDHDVFIFSSGTLVTWGLSAQESLSFLRNFIKADESIEIGPYEEPETEEMDYYVSEDSRTRLTGDIIVLSSDQSGTSPSLEKDEILNRLALSHGLARSAKLAHVEAQLDNFLSTVATVPQELARTGKITLSRKAIISKIGTLLYLRQILNLNEETNFHDLPEIYWDDSRLEHYYYSILRCLVIDSRLRICNEKISYASDLQDTLREVLTENTSYRLEWTIIWLIAVEVVLAFYKYGKSVYKTKKESKNEKDTSSNVLAPN